jgi:hypothetical protein
LFASQLWLIPWRTGYGRRRCAEWMETRAGSRDRVFRHIIADH